MESDSAKILVIGAGVNGSAVITKLCRARLDAKVLARGSRYEEIREKGIIIENPLNHKRTVTRVPVINRLDPGDLYDFILVVIRKNQIAGLLPVLSRNKSLNIVFMGNNLTGPEEFTRTLDRKRIMLGTVIAGGKRDGDIIRAMVLTSFATPFGELDGSITPRLLRLVKILRQAGIKAVPVKDMLEHQITHAAGVALIGSLVMKYRCDLHALACSKRDMTLFVHARRESHQVLRTLGYRIVPPSEESTVRYAPVFLQVMIMRMMLNSRFGEVGLAYHVSQAPDEVQQLVTELKTLVERSGLPVPAIRKTLGFAG